MATLVNRTAYTHSKGAGSPFTVTIPQPAASNTLICVSYGGATTSCKIGATAFTKRSPTSLGTMEVACQDYTATGSGETSVTVTLNGSGENVAGVIFEFNGLGAYINGAAPNSTSLSNKQATVGTITTTGNALMLSAFAYQTTTNTGSGFQWWGLTPLGRVYQSGYQVSGGSGSTFWWGQIGLSDLPGAGTYSATSCETTATSCQAGAWAYTDTTGVATNAGYPNPIAAENTLAGTYYTQWFTTALNSAIAGYTDKISYNPGDTANFKIDSGNAAFTVKVYRVGYYGFTSFGAALKATITGSPAVQSAPTVDSLGATVCAWSTTATWTIPSTAVPGYYIALATTGSNTTPIVFLVRSPSSTAGTIGIMASDATWQAYNPWGATTDNSSTWTGKSLYGGNNDGTIGHRSNAVSYDRPNGVSQGTPVTSFFDSEISLVNFLEGNGLDLSYYTCADVDADTSIPGKKRLMIVNGHSEYWSSNMRDAFEQARDNNATNLAFFSANTSLWRVRWASSDTNRRYMICYKSTVGDSLSTDPTGWTGCWRDPNGSNTSRRPDQRMTGQTFLASAPQTTTLSIAQTYAGLPCYRGIGAITGLGTGSSYTCAVAATQGDELDYVSNDAFTPYPLTLLHSQSVSVSAVAAAAGYPYTGSGTYAIGMSLYRAPSGALVFGAGSWRLAWACSPFRNSQFVLALTVDQAVQQMVLNLLSDLGATVTTPLTAAQTGQSSSLVAPAPTAQPASAYGVGYTGWGAGI